MRVLLLLDKAMAKLCCVSISLFVIPSRSTAVVSLHSTASSTCLFTYSLSSSPINGPPPHSVSLPHSLDNSLHSASLSMPGPSSFL